MHVFIPLFTLSIFHSIMCAVAALLRIQVFPLHYKRVLASRMKKGAGQGREMGTQQMDQDLLAVGGVLRFVLLPLRPACDLSFRGNSPKM